MASFSLEALGSVLHIQTPTEIRDVLKTSLISKISDFEQKYSRFISNNYLAQLNASGEGNIDNEFLLLFDACFQAYHNSLGHFDITLLPLLENMGYGVALQKMEEKIGMDHIKVQGDTIFLQGTQIEFGAIGKGYMIDEIGKTLSPYEDLLINFGGDIWVGNTPKTIGLEDPYDPTRIIGKIRILQMGFASSNGQKRQFHGHHHLVNLKSKMSQDDKISVYVTHPSAMMADLYSTVLFVCPLELSLQLLERTPGLEGLIIGKDGRMYGSKGFGVELV